MLSSEQEALVRKTICDKRPERLKMDFCLGSRAAVMQLIKQECGIEMGVRTVGGARHKLIEFLEALIKDVGKKVPVRTKAKLREAASESATSILIRPQANLSPLPRTTHIGAIPMRSPRSTARRLCSGPPT